MASADKKKASMKGIAITAAIAAAIIGASFLVWYLPQSNGGGGFTPRTDSEIISDVYSRHNDLAFTLGLEFDDWKEGSATSEEMSSQISQGRQNIQDMRRQLDDRNPAPEWQESYGLYVQTLDKFTEYLDEMGAKVDANEKLDSYPELDSLEQEWRDLVDESVAAMPINA